MLTALSVRARAQCECANSHFHPLTAVTAVVKCNKQPLSSTLCQCENLHIKTIKIFLFVPVTVCACSKNNLQGPVS